MSTDEEQLYASVIAAMMRKSPELGAKFLQSPEWKALDEESRDLIHHADARIEEVERKARQTARQEAAEENYRRRQAAERGDRTR